MSFWDKVKATVAEIGDKAKDTAQDLKMKADEGIQKAQESEAWAKAKEGTSSAWMATKEGSVQVWKETGTLAKQAKDGAEAAIQGKKLVVTFTEPTLGMTLAREERSGKAVVSRVDDSGAAAALGVEVGDCVFSVQAGYPDGQDQGGGAAERPREPVIRIASYDHLMGIFPALGRPVTVTFLKPRPEGAGIPGGVVNFSMEEEVLKAAAIVSKLTSERATNPDSLVPHIILKRAKGLAFIRVAKIGFGVSVKVGTGVVVARLGDALDSWSAPCAIGTAGLGMGFQWGAELTDFMIVLNTHDAVEAFASGNQVSLGGNVGIAVGPVGRNAGLSGNIHGGELSAGERAPVQIAPCYSYSHSKGLFIGVSLEGAVIKPRKDVNEKFYGVGALPRLILSGTTEPPAIADPLYEELARGLGDGDGYTGPADPPPYSRAAAAAAAAEEPGVASVMTAQPPPPPPPVVSEPGRPATVSPANPFADVAGVETQAPPRDEATSPVPPVADGLDSALL